MILTHLIEFDFFTGAAGAAVNRTATGAIVTPAVVASGTGTFEPHLAHPFKRRQRCPEPIIYRRRVDEDAPAQGNRLLPSVCAEERRAPQ